MCVCVAPVRGVRNHIYRHAINADLYICTVITIETAEKICSAFPPPACWATNKPINRKVPVFFTGLRSRSILAILLEFVVPGVLRNNNIFKVQRIGLHFYF